MDESTQRVDPIEAETIVDPDARIGRAVRRLVDLASSDPIIRAGLEELARSVLGLQAAEPMAPIATVPSEEQRAATPAAEQSPQDDTVVPMTREHLLSLLDAIERERPRLRQPVEPMAATTPASPQAKTEPAKPTTEEQDAALRAVIERARLKGEVVRALIASLETGVAIDQSLVHRARSAGCSLWMLALTGVDADSLGPLADCYEAMSDAVDLVLRLRAAPGASRERVIGAVRWLAAVQSALRHYVEVFQDAPDGDQMAVLNWLRTTKKRERIVVEPQMRLEAADVGEATASLRAELARVREESNRAKSRVEGLHQVRYHAERIQKGRGTAHDRKKIAETISALVRDGLPVSSLELRAVLVPIVDRLPQGDADHPGYGRVIADVVLHREPPAPKAKVKRVTKKTVSVEVRRTAGLLRGTEMVLIGGERRVEAEQALTEAFGLSELIWFARSEGPTNEELERAIAKPEVSVVIQLIRWSRHQYGDAAEFAVEHGKAFVRARAGYNPNSIARAILDQASERLTQMAQQRAAS